MILPDIFFLLANSISRAAVDATIKPGTLQPWVDEIDRYVQRNGKFSKFSVLYLPLSPPPVFWDYKCRKCRVWEPPNGCTWVDGEISPRGWCVVWVPPEGKPAFSWIGELARGDW